MSFVISAAEGAYEGMKTLLGPAGIQVGIFSRDSETCYVWLTRFLVALRTVKAVRPVYISSQDSADFQREVKLCELAILYHTKKRGRINITDVTDSLYDRELEVLSHTLGKKAVIVLIDDMECGGREDKIRILTHQTKIGSLAQDLLLITQQQKESYIENITRSHHFQVEETLRRLQDIIQARARKKHLNWKFWISLTSLLVVIFTILRMKREKRLRNRQKAPSLIENTMSAFVDYIKHMKYLLSLKKCKFSFPDFPFQY